MTTYPVSVSSRTPVKASSLIKACAREVQRGLAFVFAFTISYLSVLGLASFTIAGFLVSPILGFVVLGVCLLILHKAVTAEESKRKGAQR